jgi:hypothetical protein
VERVRSAKVVLARNVELATVEAEALEDGTPIRFSK